MHRVLSANAVLAGIDAALSAGAVDPAVVAIEARRAEETASSPIAPIGEGLSRFDRPKPTIAHYDHLLEGSG